MVDLSKGHPHVSANFWLLESGPLTRNLSGACSSFITWVFKGGLISEGFLIQLKFKYSEKATKFFEISTVDFSYVVSVKCMVEILQNFVAFSKYMNFKG
jgi:hypothetical protein